MNLTTVISTAMERSQIQRRNKRFLVAHASLCRNDSNTINLTNVIPTAMERSHAQGPETSSG